MTSTSKRSRRNLTRSASRRAGDNRAAAKRETDGSRTRQQYAVAAGSYGAVMEPLGAPTTPPPPLYGPAAPRRGPEIVMAVLTVLLGCWIVAMVVGGQSVTWFIEQALIG